MQTAKLFQNGSSQAVRLPKEFRFEGDEVGIRRIGTYSVMIYEVDKEWELFMEGIKKFSDDFTVDRDFPPQAEREPLL